MTDDIKLPPLPVGLFKHRIAGFDGPVYAEMQMEAYARAAVEADRANLAGAIHYPDCWDTTAYPTLADALREMSGTFRCSECQPAASAAPVPDIPVGCEMTRNWSVTVCAEGADILTISSEHVAGVSDLEPWHSTIRGCAQHLLSFVGNAAPVAQEPVAWFTEDHLTDKSATTWDATVAERWRAKGWPVDPLYAVPVAQEPPQVTDAEIEQIVTGAGARWDGSVWKVEDADLHPMARALLYRYTTAPVAAQLHVTDEMVTRFLGWHLPQDFAPGAGISFKPLPDPLCWPIGTDLFRDPQARAMLEYVLTGVKK